MSGKREKKKGYMEFESDWALAKYFIKWMVAITFCLTICVIISINYSFNLDVKEKELVLRVAKKEIPIPLE